MSWNVRGLNDKQKRANIRRHIIINKPHIIALQETKLTQFTSSLAKEASCMFQPTFPLQFNLMCLK